MRVSRRAAASALVLLGAVAMICVASALVPGRDPTIGLEIGLGGVVLAWAAIGVRNMIRARDLAAELDARARDTALGGVACRVVQGGGRRAFVLGALRPRIYVGDGLPKDLDPEEVRAVLLHEDHHRRTRAPLRAAALEAWLALFGRVALVRVAIQARLADLEAQADGHAVTRGASVAALASALLKADPVPAHAGASFATTSDRRLRHLLALADGTPGPDDRPAFAAPYEWLPLALGSGAVIACHVMGLPFA